ncbi:restriction endonuclease subunit S [Avibacterium sp. 20-15]|uniref:restriction endonuclease subunit S n=1 Tax=unclassified Avibacterium TaxID=2685287 RepID=UPI00202729D8|nr:MULTISPECIES: restriction endonuclease subunit S [unclassified Avibacterium]MCW9732767.1 restriction endonuclease subunit S [Avibacterium sp. 20-15]URL04909.1 restriction endonuclease subunit S [Avibacterium sp. 20-132]
MKLQHLVQFEMGALLSRLTEQPNSPCYSLYDQADLQADFERRTESTEGKQICTPDCPTLLQEGDIIFSLISGTAVQVCQTRAGYVFSHNYARLYPSKELDNAFLVYLLNNDVGIKRQLITSLQGSSVMKYSLNQLRNLQLSPLPPLEVQQAIGQVDRLQRRITMLKKRVAENEAMLTSYLLNNFQKQCKSNIKD